MLYPEARFGVVVEVDGGGRMIEGTWSKIH